MLSDFPIPTKERGLWREYRQYLRDLPKLYDDKTISSAKVKTYSEWLEFRRSGVY